MREINDAGIMALAAAIVRPMVKEYKAAVHRLYKYPKSQVVRKQVLELRDFFLSDWFGVISMGTDGEGLIRDIELQVEKEREKQRRKKQKL